MDSHLKVIWLLVQVEKFLFYLLIFVWHCRIAIMNQFNRYFTLMYLSCSAFNRIPLNYKSFTIFLFYFWQLDLRCGAKRSLADPPRHTLALKSCDISSTRPHLLIVGGKYVNNLPLNFFALFSPLILSFECLQ